MLAAQRLVQPSQRLVSAGLQLRRRVNVACMASAAAAAPAPKYHVLTYQYIPEILERRGPHREAHLAAARAKLDAGKLVMAGAAGDPVDHALFIFKDSTKEDIEDYVKNDVYIINGLVTSWKIAPYMVAVGP